MPQAKLAFAPPRVTAGERRLSKSMSQNEAAAAAAATAVAAQQAPLLHSACGMRRKPCSAGCTPRGGHTITTASESLANLVIHLVVRHMGDVAPLALTAWHSTAWHGITRMPVAVAEVSALDTGTCNNGATLAGPPSSTADWRGARPRRAAQETLPRSKLASHIYVIYNSTV